MKRNILIVNHESNPMYIGGIKRVSLILASELVRMGYNCVFLTVSDKARDISLDGYENLIIPEEYNVNYSQSVINQVVGFVEEHNIDIVLNPHCDILPITDLIGEIRKTADVKVISALHFSPTHNVDIVSPSFFNTYKFKRCIHKYVIDFLLWTKFLTAGRKALKLQLRKKYEHIAALSDKLVLLSSRYQPILHSIAPKIPTEKIIAINNPILPAEFMEVRAKERRVIWVGRVGFDMKRVDLMMRVWKMIQDKCPAWTLSILGSGQVSYFEEIAKRYGIKNIEFCGFTDPEPYYSKCAVLCSTSVTEGLPMNILEGMAHGCVPLSFDSYASVKDIIDDGIDGYIIKSFNLREYSSKLLELMQNDELRNAMSKRAKEKTERFNPEMIATQWVNLFCSLENESLKR